MIICSQEYNENIFINKPTILINAELKSLNEIYDLFGYILYKENPKLNPIEDGVYFGHDLDAFSDCLRSYLYTYDELTIKIETKSNTISDYDFCRFIHILICIMSIYEFNNKLKLIISLDIMKIYSLEIISLIQNNNTEIIL